jgi:calreticulin
LEEFNWTAITHHVLSSFKFSQPDICGQIRRVHFILNYDNENKQIKKQINAPSDQLTHLFTLILKPDQVSIDFKPKYGLLCKLILIEIYQTYTVLIDNKEEATGNLEEDFDLLPPKEIPG